MTVSRILDESPLSDPPVSIFYGVGGTNGQYLMVPSAASLVDLALGDGLDPDHVESARQRVQRSEPTMGVVEGVDPNDLSEAGWGVVFPADGDPKIEAALARLVSFRAEQAQGDTGPRLKGLSR
jgi:hypothetical protein